MLVLYGLVLPVLYVLVLPVLYVLVLVLVLPVFPQTLGLLNVECLVLLLSASDDKYDGYEEGCNWLD